jgi:uncharacterized peroxidase-related enzyme
MLRLYPLPAFDDFPEDFKETFLNVQEKMAFMPNVLFVLTHRPERLRAFLAYNEVLMNRDSGLTAAEKEMIIIALSYHWMIILCPVPRAGNPAFDGEPNDC